MPKVYLSEIQYLCSKLSAWVYGQMKIKHISQAKLASEMGISQQALSLKLKKNHFSYEDFLTFVKVFDPPIEELVFLIKKGGFNNGIFI